MFRNFLSVDGRHFLSRNATVLSKHSRTAAARKTLAITRFPENVLIVAVRACHLSGENRTHGCAGYRLATVRSELA